MTTTTQTPRHISLALARRERMAALGSGGAPAPWLIDLLSRPADSAAPHIVAARARRERLAGIGATVAA